MAFARVDDEIARLLKCLRGAGRLDATAVFVVGDHGYLPVHTDVRPNVALARAHLLEPAPGARVDVRRWDAIARSNGGSAFVYARDESAALRARSALASAAEESRAFRIVSAEEMLRLGADPEAWFGLAAEPGFVFDDAPRPQLLQPAVLRSAGGYLPDQPQMRAGFAAWGRGLRSGIRIPAMRQVDVAPTVAQLLGLRLDGADGRPLVGVLGGSSAERSRSSSPRPRKRAAR